MNTLLLVITGIIAIPFIVVLYTFCRSVIELNNIELDEDDII